MGAPKPSSDADRVRINGRRRLGVRVLLGAAVCCLVGPGALPLGMVVARPVAAEPVLRPLQVDAGDVRIAEPGYVLVADPTNGILDVGAPGGGLITSLPLTALVGRSGLPAGSTTRVARQGGGLVATTLDAAGATLCTAAVDPSPRGAVVRFAARLGPQPGLRARFFADGSHGIDLTTIGERFTPDPGQQADRLQPTVDTAARSPLAPAPFDLELHSAAGWLGVGLVEVPNATTMSLDARGGIGLDYPLSLLDSMPDQGGGGRDGGLIRFPGFLLTVGDSALGGLGAYHDALAALGAVVSTPAQARPAWWQQPIVDTWGEQMADGASRGSARYTAEWVRHFVDDWRGRFGVRDFTVVIDSRWQRQIGDPEPDPVRFGGYAGMRRLIDDLHAQGLRVELWWPLWGYRLQRVPPARAELVRMGSAHLVDPTASTFEAEMAARVDHLLGTAPGDLGADGLKLDWAYDIPTRVSHPERGWGAAALYRYLAAIHDDAHRVRPDAMVETSAAAPQFAAVSDAIRLYDAWSDAEWGRRAAIVSAADPGALIDGDGWQASPADALAHAVSSTVYGVPAFYFGTHWVGGAPIPAAQARMIGAVMALAAQKGPGSARRLASGGWSWSFGGALRAQTLDGDGGLVVWGAATGCVATGRVIGTRGGQVLIPTPAAGVVTASVGGRRLLGRPGRAGVLLTLPAGATATLSLARAGC